MKSGLIAIAACFLLAGVVYVEAFIQNSGHQIVLAPGVEQKLADFNLTASFDSVTDSRCPTGTQCIWEGDAAVIIRLGSPGSEISLHTLHTSKRFAQETEHGNNRIRLIAVTPHPAAEMPIPPQEYRVVLSVARK